MSCLLLKVEKEFQSPTEKLAERGQRQVLSEHFLRLMLILTMKKAISFLKFIAEKPDKNVIAN